MLSHSVFWQFHFSVRLYSINICKLIWTLSSKIMTSEFINKLWQAKLLYRCSQRTYPTPSCSFCPCISSNLSNSCIHTLWQPLLAHSHSFSFLANHCLISVPQEEKSFPASSRISPCNSVQAFCGLFFVFLDFFLETF